MSLSSLKTQSLAGVATRANITSSDRDLTLLSLFRLEQVSVVMKRNDHNTDE
jgi:hypothetical protein